ncbi:MAG: hypothetical protein EBU34_12250, partial [Alphaproteobacteria bacterium]|nr:hypothetical protein [Alphaproteobacteria bacterium]
MLRVKKIFYPAYEEEEDQAPHSQIVPAPSLFLQGTNGSSSTSTSLTGTSTNVLPATLIGSGNFKINLVWDSTVTSSTFQTAIGQAASAIANVLTDSLTVNLGITNSGTGGGASAGPSGGLYETYSWVYSHLKSSDPTFNALPNTSSIQGQSNVAVWNAQLKLWGLAATNALDGSASFATDIGSNALFGVALHELTHAFGRVPTMLNFTAGIRNLKAAVKIAGVRRVYTAHRFVEQGKLEDLTDALSEVCQVDYLEDVRASLGLGDKLFAAAAGAMPRRFRAKATPDSTGVVLFTSGSFGAPRGVILSQANLVTNVRQIAAHIDLDPAWVFFNPLPTFHCFGLTAGVLLPILNGMKAFEYPSPLHVKQIPTLIRESGASVLLATDTFVNQYARAADPGDLSGLKFVVCGAEKVRDETHKLVKDRFGPIPLLEGYGATEAAPVIAVNKPTDNRHGTVGGL